MLAPLRRLPGVSLLRLDLFYALFLIKSAKNAHKSVYIAFLDVRKAFDSISH